MSVQRYEPGVAHVYCKGWRSVLDPAEAGSVVLYADYAAVVDALRRELAEARRERDSYDAAIQALEEIRDAGEIDEYAHDRAVMGLVQAHLAATEASQ